MDKFERKNFLVVISAPSGGGKTTICKALLDYWEDLDYSISYTTRKPRKDEINGESYFFVSNSKFYDMINRGDLLEYAKVHNNYYGTSLSFINNRFSQKHNVVMDVDVQGAMEIVRKNIDCVTIFLMPPSLSILKQRLFERGSDTKEEIELRLSNAIREMQSIHKYQYLVVNDNLERTITQVNSIIIAERNKVLRYINEPEQKIMEEIDG